MSRIRITGGHLSGRFIKTIPSLRPSPEIARKALFDILGPSVQNKQFLDLFAGSGAIGFEALSRGANRATFIDKDRNHYQLIKQNAQDLGVSDLSIIRMMNVDSFLEANQFPYDFIFADPWYEEALDITGWDNPSLLADNGIIIIEHRNDTEPIYPDAFKLLNRKRYGDTVLSFFTRA
ncbi:MAG: 16S rRNA (guanine(966)-N(2))-methyltransferase RsmD [Patescibacteria group bacterium]